MPTNDMKGKTTFYPPIILFFITLVIYAISNKGEGAMANYFVLLADAFLQGHLNIIEHPPWLNELVFWRDKYFVVFPPMPAFLLMPFVAIFGKQFYQPALSIILGAVNVSLAYLIFLNFFKKKLIAWSMSILYGFGTIQWYHAQVGSAWYLAHITSLFFLWLALLETVTRQRLFLIGLFIGAAYLSRLPTILSFVFVLIFLYEKFISFNKSTLNLALNFRNLFLLGIGFLPAIFINGAYNYFRFGVINDISYSLLPIFSEPWYKYGLFNIRYIPIHLREIFTSMPIFISNPPYIIPSLFAMAIWIVTPALILIVFAKFKTKVAIASVAALIMVALPSLMHGGNGFTQFGYRHTLDYLPFLLLLTASGMIGRNSTIVIVLILLSILVNLWGVVMISHLGLWGWPQDFY